MRDVGVGLAHPERVARIRDADAAFEGRPVGVEVRLSRSVRVPASFAGSDIDGLYFYSPIHGLWERRGHVLIQEHKTCRPEEYDPTSGQAIALRCLAELSDRLDVAITFGPPNDPTQQSYITLGRGGRGRVARRHGDDPSTWLHARWLEYVRERRPW